MMKKIYVYLSLLFLLAGVYSPLVASENVSVKDDYLQGYLKAYLDINYNDYNVDVKVEKGRVKLFNLPNNDEIRAEILDYIEAVTAEGDINSNSKNVSKTQWLPQSSLLFCPPMADPRRAEFSAGYRMRDNVLSRYLAAVSFGDVLSFYRINNVSIGNLSGDMEIALEPGVWSVFDTDKSSFPEINTDYRIGVTVNYACQNNLSFRGRLYHISTHLGDEYMLANNITNADRKNVSYESVDFLAAYDIYKGFRVFGGVGFVLHSDKEYHIQPLSIEYGAEVKILKREYSNGRVYGQPFLAMHFKNKEDNQWNQDSTYALGYEWGRTHCEGRKVRMMAEYHHGYSLEGQFGKQQTNYGTLKFSYSY